MSDQFPEKLSSRTEISEFLQQMNQLPATRPLGPGRIIFALDATASREPSWQRARQLHGEMFRAAKTLSVQLCYYRGLAEFNASRWGESASRLEEAMAGVQCLGGYTQITLLLEHALYETRQQPVNALIFIGDAMEESLDTLSELAGQCRLRGLPLFIFQEGRDAAVQKAFKRLCTLSGGAYAQLDEHSAAQLAALLRAVATYASGGVAALRELKDNAARLLLEQL